MGKTIGETQDIALGGFKHALRGMNADQRLKYAPLDSPDGLKYKELVAKSDERTALRRKMIKEFDKTEVKVGNMKGLTSEEVNELKDLAIAFKAKRTAFLKDLDKNFPVIEVYGL